MCGACCRCGNQEKGTKATAAVEARREMVSEEVMLNNLPAALITDWHLKQPTHNKYPCRSELDRAQRLPKAVT